MNGPLYGLRFLCAACAAGALGMLLASEDAVFTGREGDVKVAVGVISDNGGYAKLCRQPVDVLLWSVNTAAFALLLLELVSFALLLRAACTPHFAANGGLLCLSTFDMLATGTALGGAYCTLHAREWDDCTLILRKGVAYYLFCSLVVFSFCSFIVDVNLCASSRSWQEVADEEDDVEADKLLRKVASLTLLSESTYSPPEAELRDSLSPPQASEDLPLPACFKN